MATLFHGRYNRNELRNFPLVDGAGRAATSGDLLPPDFLADISLRYPMPADGSPGIPYISGVLRTPTLASVTVACRTAAGDVLLGAVTVTRPSSQTYRPIRIDAMEPGVGGWVVFGAGASGDPLRLAFGDPRQTEILPKLARTYPRPPVTSIGRAGRQTRLIGNVRITGAGLVTTAQEPEKRNIVISLSRTASPAQLAEFVSVCLEGRGGECSPAVIKTINRVTPDQDGNIQVDLIGLETRRLLTRYETLDGQELVPEGLALLMPIGLIDICPVGKDLYPALAELPECE